MQDSVSILKAHWGQVQYIPKWSVGHMVVLIVLEERGQQGIHSYFQKLMLAKYLFYSI